MGRLTCPAIRSARLSYINARNASRDDRGADFDWEAENAKARQADIVPVKSEDPAYILYTSGTTGTPKGVIRSTAGHIVALKWSMENIYNCRPGDVYWAASDVGWVVGHSYIVYAPLFAGCTTVLFEGKPIGTPMPLLSGGLFPNIRYALCSPPQQLFGH